MLRLSKTLILNATLLTVGLLGLTAGSASAAGRELIANGSFEQVTAGVLAPGWKAGDPALTQIIDEAGRRFLRIHLAEPGAAITSQQVKVDGDTASITVKARLRAQGLKIGPEPWMTGRIQVLFADSDKKQVGGWNAINLPGDEEWTEHSLTLEVPPGAASVDVQCGVWNASGTVDFDDVSVIAKARELPIGKRLQSSEAPVEVSRTRSEIELGGDWMFKEAEGESERQPTGAWRIRAVPGSVPEPIRRMWYERDVYIPAKWAGRRIELELQRVSTDAKLWINGEPAGDVRWPGGTVDISSKLKPGQSNAVRLLVVAVDDRAEVEELMGYASNTKSKAQLASRGLIGPVTVHASPQSLRASDLQLIANVADRTLRVDVETDQASPKALQVNVASVDGGGPVALVAAGGIAPGKSPGTYTQTFKWPDVKLWDVGQPNLYRVTVDVQGDKGLDDQLVMQTFGFREFKIDGCQFLLNGTRIHLRPALLGRSAAGTGRDAKSLLAMGFNFGEIWPSDLSRRGSVVDDDAIIAEADRVGLLISGNALHMRDYVTDVAKSELPETRAEYARQMEPLVRRWRNSPSIVMWGTSGNLFQNQADGAPEYLGRRDFISQQEYFNLAKRCEALIGLIKSVDPNRPVFTHFGTYTGDVYTSNLYLNFIPLQEREEWMTQWAKNGQMPFMAVEFGVPFWSTWTRGRDGFPQSGQAEVFLSEWAARYLGKEAYAIEPAAFRQLLAERYVGGSDRRVEYGKVWWYDKKDRIFTESEPFRRVQDLYVTNTWRAWRTLGISGGMIPWDNGMNAAALSKVDGPSLAWIGGKRDHELAKDHHFLVGDLVQKQIILINDFRSPQPYEVRWEVRQNEMHLAGETMRGMIAVGDTLKLPIAFKASKVGEGRITVQAIIGSVRHEDEFKFNVLPRAEERSGTWLAFDPEGETTQLLKDLGYAVKPWTAGTPPVGSVVVIGRRGLSGNGHSGQHDLPADLTNFVRHGGRVLVMAQDPEWTRLALHLRVANHVARRAFAVQPQSALMEGLTDDALRDWNGSGSLIEAHPLLPGYESTLQYGWHNGNQGSVTSDAIEKPHCTSLRPLIECEFDLAYSPLMEMELGEGRVTLCTLDFESRDRQDPAATLLASRIMRRVQNEKVAPKAKRVVYVGDDRGSATLKQLGVMFTAVERPAASDELLVVGGGAIPESDIRAWVELGGTAVVLRRTSEVPVLGADFDRVEGFHGSSAVPAWPEAAGLSASDLHYRADTAAWLVKTSPNVESAADRMLGRSIIGKGQVIFAQIGPDAVPADEKRYFRFTRWRQTRALSQVLSNAGATFVQDEQLLKLLWQPDQAWLLQGEWRANLTASQVESARREWRVDGGMSDAAQKLIAAGFEGPGQVVPVPAYMESYGPEWKWVDGEVLFRKQIDVPPRLAGHDMYWSLGRVDEKETSFVNGVEIGSSTHWLLGRGHPVPGKLVTAGKNNLAVRVFDSGIHGGLCGEPTQLYIRTTPSTVPSFYHDDYYDDGVNESAAEISGWEKAASRRAVADNPYRYYRW